MGDITKARVFLTAIGSDLQHLTSFGLMLATAKQRYMDIQRSKKGNLSTDEYDERETGVALNYAVLSHLKRTNRLPANVTDAFAPGTTLEQKQGLIMAWMRA